MPKGKPAGTRCVQLDEHHRCRLFGHPERPRVCRDFTPTPALCGDTRHQALERLTALERDTTPP